MTTGRARADVPQDTFAQQAVHLLFNKYVSIKLPNISPA